VPEPTIDASRNSADTGLRIFNSIEHYDLNIAKAAFTRGESTHTYFFDNAFVCWRTSSGNESGSNWVVFFWE
jgi:hypothetical protein